MKTMLVIVTVIFGPSYPTIQTAPKLYMYDAGTEQECQRATEQWQRASGQIIGAPGYRRLQSAWCEDPKGTWPTDEMTFPKAPSAAPGSR